MSGRSGGYIDENGIIHIGSGADNYFNNGVYTSGWTYFGRTIDTPLFTPELPVNGITNGIIPGYNRLISYNISFKGFLTEEVFYKTHFSYTKYKDWFDEPPKNDEILRTILEFYVKNTPLPFEITVGTAADFDNFSNNNWGGFIKISKKGVF